MAKTSKIVYVTQAQYDSLINDGSVTIYGVTYTYDANNTYLVREDGIEGADVLSTGATSGKVLTADGNGGATWAAGASGDVTASGTLSVGSVMVGLGGKLITALNGSNGKILGWNGGAVWQDPPKVYMHNLLITVKDENNHSYYCKDIVYSTQSTNLITNDINSFVEYVKKYADDAYTFEDEEYYYKTLIDNDYHRKTLIVVGVQAGVTATDLEYDELVVSSSSLSWNLKYAGTLTTIHNIRETISEV